MLHVQRWTEVSKDAAHQTNTASSLAAPESPANRPAITRDPAHPRATPNCPQTSASSDEGINAAASRSEPPSSPRDPSTRQSYSGPARRSSDQLLQRLARIRRTA